MQQLLGFFWIVFLVPSRNGNIVPQGPFSKNEVAPTTGDQLTATPINARSQDPLSRPNGNNINFRSPDDFDCSGRYGLFADISSGCTSYWVCMPNGLKHLLQCPAHLRFNELLGACDWPDRVSCSSLMVGGGFCADKIGFYPDPNSNCKSYYFCSAEGRTYNFTCPGVLLYNEVNGACDDPQNVQCLTARMLDGFDCTGRMGLFADVAQGCRVYYSCNAYGKKTRLQCPQGQIFNEKSGICDIERTVICGPDGSTSAFDIMGNALDSRSITQMTANTIPIFDVQTPPTITLLGVHLNQPGHEEAVAFTDIRDRQQMHFGGGGNFPQLNIQPMPGPLQVDVPHQEQIIPVDNFRPKDRPNNFNAPDGFASLNQNSQGNNVPQGNIPSRTRFPEEFMPLQPNFNSGTNPNSFDQRPQQGDSGFPQVQQNFPGAFAPPQQQDVHPQNQPDNQQRPNIEVSQFALGQPVVVNHPDNQRPPNQESANFPGPQPNTVFNQPTGDQHNRENQPNGMFNPNQPNREPQFNTVFNQPLPNREQNSNGNSIGDNNQQVKHPVNVNGPFPPGLQPNNGPFQPGHNLVNEQADSIMTNNGPGQNNNNMPPNHLQQPASPGSAVFQQPNFNADDQPRQPSQHNIPNPNEFLARNPLTEQERITQPVVVPGNFPSKQTNQQSAEIENNRFPMNFNNNQNDVNRPRINNNNNQNIPQLAQPNNFPFNNVPPADDLNSIGIPNRAFGISPPAIGAGYSAEQQPSNQNSYRPQNAGQNQPSYGLAQPNTAAGLGGTQLVLTDNPTYQNNKPGSGYVQSNSGYEQNKPVGSGYAPSDAGYQQNKPSGSGYAQPNTAAGYGSSQSQSQPGVATGGGSSASAQPSPGLAQPNTAMGANSQPAQPSYSNSRGGDSYSLSAADTGKNYGGGVDNGYNMGVGQEGHSNNMNSQGHIPDNNQYGEPHFDAGTYGGTGNVQPGGQMDYNQEPQRPVINAATGYFASLPQPGGGGSPGGQSSNAGYGDSAGSGSGYGTSNENQNEFSCRGLIGYYPDLTTDCRVYYYCKADGSKFQFRCPADLRYNATLGVCDWPRNVQCMLQRPGPGNLPTWNESPFYDCQGRTGFFGDSAREYRVFYYCERDGRKHRFVCPSNLRFNDARAACDWPENIFKGPYAGEQEFDCSGKRGYFGNPNTPSVYYFCEQDGTARKFVCSDKLIFNFQIGSCDWPERLNVNNGFMDGGTPMYRSNLPGDALRIQGKEAAIGMSIKPLDAQESQHQQALVKSTLSKNTFQCTPGKYGFFSDITTNCQKYFYCRVDGKNFSFSCPNSLRFNEKLGACDLERNVPCIASGSPGFAQLAVQKTFFDCKGKSGLLPDFEEKCRTFFNCEPDGSFVTFACSDGLLFNSLIGACDRAESVQCKAKTLNQTLSWKLGM